ncbi:DNA-dependent RNA polymerase [Acinetobacter phage nACB1]|nr:DNA-dependent RNA polymerase [Acinetobacter phage nACB1]
MADYKSLQVSDALSRITNQLKPQVTYGSLGSSVYGRNTNTPDAIAADQQAIQQGQQYYNSIYGKTGSDYVQDAGVALAKGVVSVPQAAAGIVDLLDAGAQFATGQDVQGGRFSKNLADVGVDFATTQDIMSGWFSEGTQRQMQELAALPGMSTEQSLGQNLNSLGSTLGYVADNPSIALNTIIQSLPSIAAGGVVGRGAAALGARGAAGAIGEGTIMSGQAQANMERNAEGYTTGQQALGALGIGVLGGLVGQAGNRIAATRGAADIDQVAAGVGSQAANQGFKSLTVGTATEAAEEAAQSALENVITNVSSGKDAIQGLNQDLVLGTLAGAGMGAAVNAKSSIGTAALEAVQNAANKQIERAKEKISREAPEQTDTPTEQFTDPSSPSYNPSAALVREAKKLTEATTPEEQLDVRNSFNYIMEEQEAYLGGLIETRDAVQNIDNLRQSIVNADAAVERFAESDPAKAEQIAAISANLKEQVAVAEQFIGNEQTLDAHIAEVETKVQEARDIHTRYDSLMQRATTNDETMDTQIFGAPQKFTPEQIEKAINDPKVPEASKPALRALADAVVAQNAVKNIDAVNQQITGKQYDSNYRSTPQYLAQFTRAIKQGNTAQQVNLMREIGAFEQSHVQKAEIVQQGLELASSGQPVQIIRNQDGSWAFNQGEWLSRTAAKKNGAITIASPKQIEAVTKTSEYMQAEAQAITATRNAMEQLDVLNNPNGSVVRPSNVATQSTPETQEVPTQQATDFQAAIDELNSLERDNYDYQPQRRVEDPRESLSQPSFDGAINAESQVPTGTQSTSGTMSSGDTSQVQTPTNTEGTTPVAKAERVASRSVSEDVATEVQTSTEAATQATNEETTEEVVTPEVKKEAEPQDINTVEKADKNPARTAERAKEPKKRNLVIDGFNQRDTVLNRNENFVKRFMNRSNIAPVVESITGKAPTPKQEQALKDFTNFANYFDSKLDIIGSKQEDFRFQDFNQFLLVDGKLPDNVKTAVSAAMYSWIAENGSKTLNTERDVAGLLLLNDIDTLPTTVFNAFTGIGDHQSVVTGSLGQKALEALGLKVVSDVDPARKQKLEQALGTLAAVALTQNGYLEHTAMSVAEFELHQAYAQNANEGSTFGDQTFKGGKTINFLVPKAGKKVDQVIKSAAETQGIVQSLFGVQRDIKLPSLEPVTSTPQSFNRMGSELPSYTKDMLEAAQSNGYKMSIPAMQFMDNVKQDDLLELFGFIKPNADGVSFDGMHKKFWKSQLASNEAVERAVAIIKEQRANLGDDSKEFFFEHTSWTNTRSGYDSAFNLQANKMHRAVAGMSAHVVEVGIEAPIKNGETTKFGEFLMAVAMGAEGASDVMGIQTVDKVSAETFLPKFQEYLAQDYVQAGIESMAAAIETKPTKQDMDNIKRVVTEFDMGPMSVRALQALAQMHIAERDGQRTFTSDIGFESDGVTNGPVITNVALNTADAQMLEAGGIFTSRAKSNVPTNKEQGNEDIYEQLGGVMQAEWTAYKKAVKGGALDSALGLDVIYSAFGKRKGAKPIVTTSNYGAGIASIKRANAREVLNAFYTGLESAGKKGDIGAAQDLINAVNKTIKYSNFKQKLSTPLAVAKGDVMEFLLTPEQEAALFFAADLQHGEAIKETLSKAMAGFNEVRDNLTEQAVTGFKIYELIRQNAINEALKNTDGVLVDGKGKRQEGLTADQMKAVLKSIERYTPSVVSGMGNLSSNKKKSSIPLMKQDTVWDGSAMSEQQFKFLGSWQQSGTKEFSVRSAIKRDAVSDPGVSGLALIIQSIDAMIAHTTIGKMPTQNYHDANASAVGQGKAMAKIQNEAFVDGVMHTHVNREFARALMNPLTLVLDNKAFYTANKDEINDAMKGIFMSQKVATAYERDLAKLTGMLKWVNVNQYGTQGGHFQMTNAKRKEILDEIAQLKKDYAKDAALAKRIDEIVESGSEPQTVEEHLRQNIIMTGKEVVPLLQAELKQFQGKEGQVGKFSQFYDSILDLVTKQMPSDLEINYFSDLEAPENVNGLKEAVDNNNPAWFTTGKDGKPQINILRSDAPIRAQVLVHELVHAITVDSISQVRKDPTAHAKAAESLAKLDALYEDIKAKVNADPNATDLQKYAVKNVEEFIATGFSYPEFVDYLDSQLAPKAARGKNRIVTALRSFVDSILGVLESFTGRKYSAKDATALEALIIDSTEFLGRAPTQTTGTQTSIFGAPQQARNTVDGYTAYEVFSTLPKHANPQFQAHLNQMMRQVADTIYSGLDQKLIDNNDGAWSIEKAWEEYTTAGNAETTETAVTAGFRMTEQEAFAVESIYAAMVHGLKDKSMTQVYAEMNKAYNSAKARLKPENFYQGDWATATRQDKADAQDMYDYFFKLGPTNKQHLARFISMALGSEQVNSMLGFAVKDTSTAPSNTFENIVEKANTLLDFVGGVLTNSNSAQNINNRVGLLAKELARIDMKNREHAVGRVEAQLEAIADYTDGVSKKLRERVVEFADKDAIANNRNTYVRLASNTTRLAAKGDLWTVLDTLKEANNIDNPNSTLGMMGEIINEAANNDSTKNHVEKMMRITKLNNQMKENIRHTTTKNVMSTFEDNGQYLTKDHKAALTTMLRSDVQVLSTTYSTKEIAQLYTDGKFLQNETAAVVNQLKALGGDQVMINRAKQLAKYMLTGNSSIGLAKNAQLIVSGFNSGEVVDLTDPRVDLVDKLATMYAIEYTDKGTRNRLGEVFKRELKNKTNGVDTSIKFHHELSKEARNKLFVDNATSVVKGFVPEITNPNKEVRIATNDTEARLYKEQYYREVKSMVKDKSDKTGATPRLFITDEANVQRLVSGAVEIVSTNRKGTGVNMDAKEFTYAVNSVRIPNSPLYNPMLDQDVYMVPNYNTQNEVVGFSYEMSGNNRDSLLERNNDFSELLGAYAATNFNKVTVPDQNNKVIDAAYQDYKDNFVNNPRAYITVGPGATNPALAETWAMLPEDTRRYIESKFGPDGMVIRNDVYLTMFGYRKYSLNQAFDKMPEARNMFESIYTDVMNTLFGGKARLRGVQGERAWQEAVSTMKDIIVIRNVKTLIGNTISNALLLSAHGVSFTDIAKDTATSIRAGLQYRRDMANLLSIRQKQKAGVGDFNKLEQEALRIEDSMSRNPLADFINEGMMPTIVEDLDPSNDHYSYKSKLQERIDGLTTDVPKSVKTAAKWLMVSPDTPLYQFLNNATQFSDFSSKYVLYKHYTTKAKEKLGHEEAIQIAQDNFINYDIPTSRGLQYLNDMGVVMFTKYNLRIQKALFQLMKKRPASVMAQALLIGTLTNMETAIDPIVFTQFGNPLRTGAFGLPSALDEPLPIKMLTGL